MSTASPVPARRSWRRRLLVVGAVAIVLAALVAGVLVAGNRLAESRETGYQKAWAMWKNTDRDAIRIDATVLPDGLYHPRDPFSRSSRAEQRTACKAVGEARDELDDRVRRMPRLGSGVLGLVHPTLKESAREADERIDETKAFVRRADKALTQIHADCAWAVKAYRDDRAARGRAKMREARSMFVKRGTTGFGLVCQAKRCLPLDPGRRARALRLLGDGQALQVAWTRSAFTKGCSDTSYGPLCAEIVSMAKRLDRGVRRCLSAIGPDLAGPRAQSQCSSLLLDVDDGLARLADLARSEFPQLKQEAPDDLYGIDVPDILLYYLAESTLQDLDRAGYGTDGDVV